MNYSTMSNADKLHAGETEKRWTPSVDKFILKQRNERRRLWIAIASSIGASYTAEDVRGRYDALMRKILRPESKVHPKQVRCLGHGEPHYFLSPDPRRIHLCPACKVANEGVMEGFNLSDESSHPVLDCEDVSLPSNTKSELMELSIDEISLSDLIKDDSDKN